MLAEMKKTSQEEEKRNNFIPFFFFFLFLFSLAPFSNPVELLTLFYL